jgi:hypothetical protein
MMHIESQLGKQVCRKICQIGSYNRGSDRLILTPLVA